jgi:Fur family iron response transcriptional regulator
MSRIDRAKEAARQRIRESGLRPTRQRLALARLLFENGDRHVTAESLHAESKTAGERLSLATVYNTLHQFTAAGLLRQVTVEAGRSYFDTNVSDHHHFLVERSGELIDIPAEAVDVRKLPVAPKGHEVARVDVIVRLKPVERR